MPSNIDILINGKDMTGPAVSSAKNGLASLSGSVDAVNGKFNAMTVAVGTVIGNVATAGIAKMGEFAASVVTTGINFNTMKEQADIAFTTMLGSGEKAQAFLDKLQAFAAKTPFEFPDLVMASQRMLAMGIQSDKVLPTLTAIGDAVAGLGGSSAMVDRVTTALGQMQAKGKATGEEMMQLTEAGIPAWDFLAKKIGVSIPEAMKMVTAGAVSADVAITALTDGMNTKFGGMMEKQSATFAGLWSTIKDTFGQISGKVMQPLFEQMTRGFQMIVDWTNAPAFTAGVKLLTGWMEKLGFAVGVFIDSIAAGRSPVDALANAISVLIPHTVFDVWVKFDGVVRGGIRIIQSLFVEVERFEDDAPMVGYLLDLGDRARETFKLIFDWSVKVIGKLWNWAEGVMPPLVEGIVKFFDHLGMITEAIKTLFKPLGDAITKFMKVDDVMTALAILLGGPVLAAFGGILVGLAQFLAPIAAVAVAIAGLRWAWENDFLGIRTFTLSSLKKMSDWFFNESGIWKGTFEKTLEYLAWWADGGWKNDIYFPIRSWLTKIGSEIQVFKLFAGIKFEEWVQDVVDYFNGLYNDTSRIFTQVKDVMISTFNQWVDPIKKTVGDWVSLTSANLAQWVDDMKARFTNWKDDMLERFNGVFVWWDEHVQPWIDYGAKIVQGLWDGMVEVWELFKDWWGGVWDTLTGTVEIKMEMQSPSRKMARYGQYLMEGLGNGIKAYANLPVSMMESTVNSLTSQMDRLKGAVVQNVFDINNAVKQLNLNPATMPGGLGGTGTGIGIIPGTAGGTILLSGGINNLPHHTPLATGTSAGGNYVPLNTEITTLGESLGTDTVTAQAAAESIELLGGLTLQTVDLAQAKDNVTKAIEESAKKMQDFIAGIGDFLSGTLTGANSVFSWFNYQENNAYKEGKLQEYIGSETAQTKTQLKGLYQGIQNSIADILGISTSELNVTGGDSKRLIDRMSQLITGTGADTNMEFIGKLLQSAVDFRNLSNYGTGAEYYKDVLPTDGRLTGSNQTTNQFNITLAGSSNASADVMGMVQLLSSLAGTASP